MYTHFWKCIVWIIFCKWYIYIVWQFDFFFHSVAYLDMCFVVVLFFCLVFYTLAILVLFRASRFLLQIIHKLKLQTVESGVSCMYFLMYLYYSCFKIKRSGIAEPYDISPLNVSQTYAKVDRRMNYSPSAVINLVLSVYSFTLSPLTF